MVDHEGGRVHRLPPPFTDFRRPPPSAAPASLAWRRGGKRVMARELRAAGSDSGSRPCSIALLDPANTVIGDRAFGVVAGWRRAAFGVAFVQAMLGTGLVPVAKHFPGTG